MGVFGNVVCCSYRKVSPKAESRRTKGNQHTLGAKRLVNFANGAAMSNQTLKEICCYPVYAHREFGLKVELPQAIPMD